MLGFSPLADNALADDAPVAVGAPVVDTNRDNFALLLSGPVGAVIVGGVRDAATIEVGYEFQPSSVVTAAPVLALPALSYTYDVTADGIVTAAPIVASAGLSLVYDVTATSIATAAPLIGTPSVDVFSLLVPDAIVTGAPILTLPALSAIHNFTAADVTTGSPVVATVDLSSQQDLFAVGIVTAAPILGLLLAGENQPIPVNGVVTGAPIIGGITYGAGSFDGFIHAIQTGDALESTYDGYWFSDDGTQFFRGPQGSAFGPSRYALGTPFDISTATLVSSGVRFDLANDTLRVINFQISSDGTKFYSLTRRITNATQYTYEFSTYGLSPAFNTGGTYSFESAYFLSQVPFSSPTNGRMDAAAVAGGNLYTIRANLDNTRDIQRRTLTATLLNEVQLINIGSSPRIAPLVLDGSLRIYVHGDVYSDALTLLDTSSAILEPDALGYSANYLVRPDGFAILTPTLLEFDDNPQPVTIQQAGVTSAFGIVTAPPILAASDLDQKHVLAFPALLTGNPVISAALKQESALQLDSIVASTPALAIADIVYSHQLNANAFAVGLPILQTADAFHTNVVVANDIVMGEPNLGLLALSEEEQFLAEPITAGQPSLSDTGLVQGNDLAAVSIDAALPELDLTFVTQGHQVDAPNVIAGFPILQTADALHNNILAANSIVTGEPNLGLMEHIQEGQLFAELITAGQPSLQDTNLIQDNKLIAVDAGIITGPPASQAIGISEANALLADGIVAGEPDVGLLAFSKAQESSVVSITTGAPYIGSTSISEGQKFVAVLIATGQPSLQDSALAQDEKLTAANTNAAPPTLALALVSQVHRFALNGVTTEPPLLGQTEATQGRFSALRIVVGNPAIGLLIMRCEQALGAESIITASPTLVTLTVNASSRRIADQSTASNNNVAVTTGPNNVIVSERYIRSA